MRMAMYLRLSLEDDDTSNESNSIINQRLLINHYLSSAEEFLSWEIIEYADDGYSGTNFDRPGITNLIQDIQKGLIQGIIVKDFSRFSRDYIEMGAYLDQIFPFMRVRFISIGDQYDSMNHRGNTIEIDTAFKTLLNDFYSKDLSAKVKSAIQNKCENGEYAFGGIPLGYEKTPQSKTLTAHNNVQKNQIRINEREADIVRRIFELSDAGLSSVAIERQLNKERVPTYHQLRGKKLPDSDKEKLYTWGASYIRSILDNRVYIGEFEYHKTETPVVGSRKRKKMPQCEWICIPNHHEAIISQEMFERVGNRQRGNSTKHKHPKHPLTGKLYCGGCGYSMSFKRMVKGKMYPRFECSRHARLKVSTCCTYFNAGVLSELVLTMLNKELLKVLELTDSREALITALKNRGDALNGQIRESRRRVKEIEQEKMKSYETYAEGDLDADSYKYTVISADQELEEKQERIKRYQTDLSETERAYMENINDLKQVLRYSRVDELTQEVMDTFVEKIKVYRNKAVEIQWAFALPNVDNL